jgi:hypothetical protein
MSHVAKITIEIQSLDALKAACKRLGLTFNMNQKTYAWYGRHVGDYPLPEGFKVEDMGKCDHAIHVPGATYEIGVVKKGNKYELLWDFYYSGGLEKILGKGGGKLKQAYAVSQGVLTAKKQGFLVTEKKMVKEKVYA